MKLRNKKTGEIIDIYKGEITLHYNQGRKTIHFKCLEDLEEWEDYEEPKEYWYINEYGTVTTTEKYGRYTLYDKVKKNFGNYFETEEEAELAVRKLKAWKRLKDKGFRFNCWYGGSKDISFSIPQEIIDGTTAKDLDLLFGGEE